MRLNAESLGAKSPSLFSCLLSFITLALVYHFGVRRMSLKVIKTKYTILKTLRYSLEPSDIKDKGPTYRVSQKQQMSARLFFLSLAVFRV